MTVSALVTWQIPPHYLQTASRISAVLGAALAFGSVVGAVNGMAWAIFGVMVLVLGNLHLVDKVTGWAKRRGARQLPAAVLGAYATFFSVSFLTFPWLLTA